MSLSEEAESRRPTSPGQLVLLEELLHELEAMGVDCELTPECVVHGILKETVQGVPAIAFMAHVDTSDAVMGDGVKAVRRVYTGGDIVLRNGTVIKASENPQLARYEGTEVITSDGSTLLGADDKAGIAAIMYMAQYVMEHPEFKHGDIKIAFTPDEEIGRGVAKFDVKKFGADYAYTIDGGAIGELEYENFNAAAAKVHVQGSNIHPGYAKNKMLNSMIVAMELNAMLPVEQRPEFTSDYEGFFHITSFKGCVEETELNYIIRDHDRQKFEDKKELLTAAVTFLNKKYGDVVTLELKHQYYNMRQEVEPHYFIVEKAVKAMEMAGVKPKVQPIRGGTDGANLSFMGLPCPNIFAGGHNFHGKLEYVPVESMDKAAEVILNIISLFAD